MALEGSRVPAWVERSPEWRAALHLLEAPALREKDVLRFVDFESRRINVLALLDRARSWSAGEELLIKAACALFNGAAVADLGELVRRLDDSNVVRIIEAVRIFRAL